MVVWVKLDSNNRPVAITDDETFTDDTYIKTEAPFEMVTGVIRDWYYDKDNNSFVYDGKESSTIATDQENAQTLLEIKRQMFESIPILVNANSYNITDKNALKISYLFDYFSIDTSYTKGKILQYDGNLYRVGQDHVSQSTWFPGSQGTEALYSKIEITEEGYEVWQEWDGVSGIYAKDQIVRDPTDEQLYKSLIDNNVWGPPSTQPNYWQLYTES